MNSFYAQRGVGMIEVLIAILVLAIGALGFAGVQLVAMQNAENANHRSSAMLIAQDAVERIQANSDALSEYTSARSVVVPTSAPAQACTGQCDISQLDLDQLAWVANQSLPNGLIKIDGCDFNGLTCVVLNWGERDGNDNANDIDSCMSSSGINVSEESNCLVMEFSR